jgi:plastocyanin
MELMKTQLRLGLVTVLTVTLVAAPMTSYADHTVVKAVETPNRWDASNEVGAQSYVHVTPGTRVVWRNLADNNNAHDLTAYGRNWDKRVMLQPGEGTAKRFRENGTFKYRCRLHSRMQGGQCEGMCGVIHVEG